MPTKQDIISLIEGHAKSIVEGIKRAQRSEDPQDDGILKQIQLQEERILNTCKVIRRYRELKSRAIYIYEAETGDYYEASKSARLKICRQLLESEGLLIQSNT